MFKRKLASIVLLCLMFAPLAVSATLTPVSAESADWLHPWEYRKLYNITGASGAGSDYQVLIITHWSEGTDSDNEVYLSNHSETDFSDVRFTDDDGITELDHWRESYTAGDSATFWVEVQDSLSADAAIYIYYGNEDAETTSNGEDTFPLFSDFQKFMDLDTWDRYSAADDYVFAEDVATLGDFPFEPYGKAEGIAYDGTYFYVSTFNRETANNSYLLKLDANIDIVDYVEVTDNTLIHAGGICLYNNYLYVPIAEDTQYPNEPSKLKRYHASTLTYVDTVCTSAELENDHWGGVFIIPELDRLYVGNWDTEDIHVFTIDGEYIAEITETPDTGIQDFVYAGNYIYGSQYDPDEVIVVWRAIDSGNDLEKVGEIATEDTRTNQGLTWVNNSFYTANRFVGEPNYVYEIEGENLNLTIENYYISNASELGPDVMIEARVNMGGNRRFNLGWASVIPSSGTMIMFHNIDGDCNIYEGNADDDCNFDIAQDTWTTLSLGWVEDHAKAYKNRGSEHTLNDGDIASIGLFPKLDLWGSADSPIYVKWLFIRNWVLTEPAPLAWGVEESPYVISAFYLWTVDAGLILLGLCLIPGSLVFAVKGGKKDMSMDKLFYVLVAFMLGWALLLGGIM